MRWRTAVACFDHRPWRTSREQFGWAASFEVAWSSDVVGEHGAPTASSPTRSCDAAGGTLFDVTANIIAGFEYQLAKAGLHRQLERPPAICFLDITGYTRLTQERGDQAASELAEQLARIVQRTSVSHGGRPVKWLGDGVMFHFRDPGPGVVAALEMVDEVASAGLPPAHVGLDSGPVLIREGDYYGQTVNQAARIADYARPGEVLVSQAVVDAAKLPPAAFSAIGSVELKGVTGTIQLHAALRHA